MPESGLLALIGLGLALGLRHGIDWDHIAAITDIAGAAVPDPASGGGLVRAIGLASLYGVGHGMMIVGLGMLAIWAGHALPEWMDPLMERVVGVTLLVLGVWIFYAIWRDGAAFRLQSRWMVVFSLIRRAGRTLRRRLTGGHRHEHRHSHDHDLMTYGPKTALGVGMLHGVGAETGTQALLLAGVAGAGTPALGLLLLLAFVGGMIITTTLVAAFASAGFVSAGAKRRVYLAFAVTAGLFSIGVGAFFVTGQSDVLPDLQATLAGWWPA